jgi:hypothetical protein
VAKTPLNIDRKWLHRIENILPRLKWSIAPLKVIQWLENFDDEDRELAFDFLLVVEYINFAELQYRLDEQLKNITDDIGPKGNVVIIPYGKFGKSGTLLTYPLKNTSSFKKLKKRALLTADFINTTIEEGSSLIMLDDFIGSGNTFIKEYSNVIKPWADLKKIKKRYLLTAFIMQEAKLKLLEAYGLEVKIFAEAKYKAFDSVNSPFTILKTVENLKELNRKYGGTLNSFPSPPHCRPLGYKNSEALISFFYGTPNNTLPIIWATSPWKSLFPRSAPVKMSEARKLKREVAFYIGLMNRLGLDLYESTSVMVAGKRQRKYNHKIDHSLLLVIRLKLQLVDDILIAQILGITLLELQQIFSYGRRKKYLDAINTMTIEGRLFFQGLMSYVKRNSFRSASEENFRIKNITYLPKSFKGVT